MGRSKMQIDFKGMEDYIKKLNELDGKATRQAVENALIITQEKVADRLDTIMAKHVRTGKTKNAIIRDKAVIWYPVVATIDIGFDLENGGFPSIYLMHGTEVRGQRHIEADKDLFDAVYGSKIRKEMAKYQEEEFAKVLKKVMK